MGIMNSSLDFLKLNKNNAVKRKIGIPENCIIGIGEKNFDRLKDKNSMLIDSDQKIFRILN